MRVAFTKMEGLGNDYVFVDTVRQPGFPLARAGEICRSWSDRNFGIGADGLILLVPSDRADVGMRMFNSDGSEGAMCGNGLRCLAALAREHGHVGDEFVVETAAGLRAVRLCRDASRLGDVEVEVGTLEVDVAPIAVAVDGHDLLVRRAWLGNPHVVVFLDSDPEEFPVARVGLALQQHAAFEGGVNVEFVQLAGPATLRQRTFERGSGETLACGTGAAAAAGVAIHEGRLVGQEVTVLLRGGPLRVYQRGLGLVISGPAHTVYRGDVELPPP